jgi:hypothetical protein
MDNAFGATAARHSWIVYELTGHDTDSPVAESNTGGGQTGTALAISLVAVAAGNQVVSSIGTRAVTAITEGSGETELAEATSTGTVEARTQVQYSTGADHDWAWTGSNANYGVALEVAAAPSGSFVPRQGMIIG